MKKLHLLVLALSVLLFGSGCSLNTDAVTQAIDQAKSAVSNINVSSSNEYHVVLVPGYGAPVTGNSTYEEYIEEVAEFVSNQENVVDTIVFTGSYSSLEDTSEAESMNSYFNSIVDIDELLDRGVHVYKEECAILSWQNISNSQELLAEEGITPDSVTIFGDEQREEKLVAFSSIVFNEDIDLPDSASQFFNEGVVYTSIDFHGFDFGGTEKEKEERAATFVAEIAGAYDAEVGNQIIALRIDEWTEAFGYDVADNLVEKGCEEYAGFR